MVRASFALAACWLAVSFVPCNRAQTPMSGDAIKAAAGDEDAADTIPAPGAPGALSPAMQRAAIRAAMRKVADWQLLHSEARFNQDWTYAPLCLGLLAASRTTGDPRYHDAVLHAAERFHWKLWAARPFHADDEAIAQVYEELYLEKREPVRIADAQGTFDRLLQRTDDPSMDLWWWCDALFMAPAGMARMSAMTDNHAYLDKMDHEWDQTTAHLYDNREHLYFRDKSYIGRTEKNGDKVF